MEYAITFLEGIITFISPCLLPMLPIYVAYFAGGVDEQGESVGKTGRTLKNALGFVVGFTILFTVMGGFAATIGGFFRDFQTVFNIVCGVIVIIFGLSFMGLFEIPIFGKLHRETKAPRTFLSSLVFGVVFAIGWTPCVGAFLGSALSLAASTGQTTQGVLLLVCYSLGLGVPFVISALLIDQLEGAFNWVKQHYKVINIICGILLVIVGVLMATGLLGLWMSALAA